MGLHHGVFVFAVALAHIAGISSPLSLLLSSLKCPWAFGCFSTTVAVQGWNLTVIHTGDTFGAVVAVNVASNPCRPTSTSYTSDLPFCLGGVARRAALISQLRSTYAHTLVVDTGNTLPGAY
jgi:2',3'-cyclic-nucleotide 2'-phosphodiesterase (5'-nucleotidase family)